MQVPACFWMRIHPYTYLCPPGLRSSWSCLSVPVSLRIVNATSHNPPQWTEHSMCIAISIDYILLQNRCTDEPVTLPSIDRSGNCKGKVKIINKPGCRQVVVRLSTNSWIHVHIMYSVVQLSPSPFCQTLRQNKEINWCCWQIDARLRACFWIHG